MNNSKLMIAVAAAALMAGTSAVFAQQPSGAPGGAPAGQMAPKSPGGGQATGQPATPGAVHNGAAETKGGKNATEERGEQTKPNRTGEAQPNRNRETTGQAPQNGRQENRLKETRRPAEQARKSGWIRTGPRRSAAATASAIERPPARGRHRTRAMSRSTSPPRSELKCIRSSPRSGARRGLIALTSIWRLEPQYPAQCTLFPFRAPS